MRLQTLLPIGKVDPGLRDVSMRLDLSSVTDMAREVEALRKLRDGDRVRPAPLRTPADHEALQHIIRDLNG